MKKLIAELGLSESDVKKILINSQRHKPKVLTRYFSDKEFKFGVVSDTHLCSIHEKLDELHTFYAICKKVGCEFILHAGDMVEGSGRIYRGQLSEINVYGALRQAEYAVKNYPSGMTTYFIAGNHDMSFFNENGVDVCKIISEKRKDLIYLGQYQADIILGGVKFRLMHHDKAPAYALSYPGQKIAEQIASGDKPHILLLGHLHSAFSFWYRLMNILSCGAFQGQTPFLMRKGINPAVGGWICTVRTGKKDPVIAFETSWIPFYGGGK